MKRAVTLKENYEFRRLYQKGASAVGGGMVLYCRKNRLGHNRLGVTVSVKLGHAVVRNRARRRLREVYRLNSGRLRQGYDMILVARGRTLTASWKELNDTFLRLCRKLELLEEPTNGELKLSALGRLAAAQLYNAYAAAVQPWLQDKASAMDKKQQAEIKKTFGITNQQLQKFLEKEKINISTANSKA